LPTPRCRGGNEPSEKAWSKTGFGSARLDKWNEQKVQLGLAHLKARAGLSQLERVAERHWGGRPEAAQGREAALRRHRASSRRSSSVAGEGGRSRRSRTGEGCGGPVAQGREAAGRRHRGTTRDWGGRQRVGGAGEGDGGGVRQLLSPVATRCQSCARAAACLRLRGMENGEGRRAVRVG
jgi:hypothetical protein